MFFKIPALLQLAIQQASGPLKAWQVLTASERAASSPFLTTLDSQRRNKLCLLKQTHQSLFPEAYLTTLPVQNYFLPPPKKKSLKQSCSQTFPSKSLVKLSRTIILTSKSNTNSFTNQRITQVCVTKHSFRKILSEFLYQNQSPNLTKKKTT